MGGGCGRDGTEPGPGAVLRYAAMTSCGYGAGLALLAHSSLSLF